MDSRYPAGSTGGKRISRDRAHMQAQSRVLRCRLTCERDSLSFRPFVCGADDGRLGAALAADAAAAPPCTKTILGGDDWGRLYEL